jgi:hypothetical protein
MSDKGEKRSRDPDLDLDPFDRNQQLRNDTLANVSKYDPFTTNQAAAMITEAKNEANRLEDEKSDALYKQTQNEERAAARRRNATTLAGNDEIEVRNREFNRNYQAKKAAAVDAAEYAARQKEDDAAFTKRGDKGDLKYLIKNGNSEPLEIAKRVIPYYVDQARFLESNQPRLNDIKQYLHNNTSVFNLNVDDFKYVLSTQPPEFLEILYYKPEYYPSSVLSPDEIKEEARKMSNEKKKEEENRMDESNSGGKKTKRRKTNKKRRGSRRKRRGSSRKGRSYSRKRRR